MRRITRFAFAFVFCASVLQGQDTTSAAPLAGNRADTSRTAVTRGAGYSFDGFVKFKSGRPAQHALVVVVPADSRSSPRQSTATDDDGRFHLDSLNGSYVLRVDIDEAQSIERKLVADRDIVATLVADEDRIEAVKSSAGTFWTLLLAILYLFTIVVTRWHHIAKSLHVMILGQIEALSARLETEVDGASEQSIKHLKDLLEKLKKGMDQSFGEAILEQTFWSRGRENANWVALHEVERQLAAFLAPPEQIDAYLRWAAPELRGMNKPSALAIADAITVALQNPPGPANEPGMRKALLGRAIALINADRDNNFATLMEWQNKASWLIVIALGAIVFLSASVGNGVLFLAGATGGYLSRLMRALRRDDVPLDYGASWTTLFLSPLFGALAAWFGIALITLLARPDLQLLGAAFRLIRWDDPAGAATLSVAFVLGFSERFFDAIVGAVEKQGKADEAARRAGMSSPPPPPSGSQSPPPLITSRSREESDKEDPALAKHEKE